MKKINITLLLVALFSFNINFAQKISHEKFDKLLHKYVTDDGFVNYKGFKSDPLFNQYLSELSNHPPQKSWSANDKLAYWINAYNAFTIKLITDNYPVKSIKDIGGTFGSPWDIEFIQIGGKTYNLSQIEHEILRKQFNEPRIHFAIVCASISCPKLRNEAYVPEKLNAQLNDQAKNFINDPSKNIITANSLKLSQIFNWFKSDFTKNGSLIDFLNKYSKVKISPTAKITYLKYNWNLNGK
jgi:hypothetical protein